MYCPNTLRAHHYVEIMSLHQNLLSIPAQTFSSLLKQELSISEKSPYHCHCITHKSILENSQGIFSYGFVKSMFPQRSIVSPDFSVLREWALKLKYLGLNASATIQLVTLGKLLNFSKLELVIWEVVIALRDNAFGVIGEYLPCVKCSINISLYYYPQYLLLLLHCFKVLAEY